SQHSRLRDLDRLIGIAGMIAARIQVEAADAGVADVAARETVAGYQTDPLTQLIIDARGDADAPLRRARCGRKGIDDIKRVRIERDRIDDGAVVDRIPPGVDKEGGPRADRAAQAAPGFIQQEGRLLLRIRVARIPELVRKVVVEGTPKLVRSRLSKDL